MTKEQTEQLKKEALEKLSELAILLKDVVREYPEIDYYDEDDNWCSKDNPNFTPENELLFALRAMAEDTLAYQNQSDLTQYYSSYCP